jgi:hypothetical protein
MNPYFIRALAFIAVFILAVILPWWLFGLVLIGLTIYFPFYLEVLFFGFLIDALYSVKYSFPYIGLTIATIFLLVVMFVRTKVRT